MWTTWTICRVAALSLCIGLSGAANHASAYTVAQRVDQFGKPVAQRLAPVFKAAGVAYPPREIAYVAFKDSREMEVYARASSNAPWAFVKRYGIRAASGKPGPKLAEGDYQVPEGIYRAHSLNPNSLYHLSIRLNYPNAFDRSKAAVDKRTRLGGDIMIHGNAVSVGCLAMGDQAAEELFILAALATPERTRIVVSPTDFRQRKAVRPRVAPRWSGELYDALQTELKQYRRTI
jgi:murein L,D-transpeptidase YafK